MPVAALVALSLAAAAAPPAAPATAPAAGEIRTLALEEALRELEAQNLSLAQARHRAEEARALVRQAAAPLKPTAVASGSYTRNSDEVKVDLGEALSRIPGLPAGGLPSAILIQPLDVFSVTGSVRVPILAPSGWFDLGAAGQAAEAADASYQTVRLQVRAALAQSAWLAAMGEEIVQASERAVETAREQEGSARRAVAAGTAAPLSVLQAQTETTRRESDLVRARSDLDRARLALGVFLGRSEPIRVTLARPPPAPSLDAAALADEALARRPELRAQDAQVRGAERRLSSARWRYAPQLSATGAAFAASEPYPTQKKEGWRVTVDLTWPLYDGGLRYGKASEAEAALARAEAERGEARITVAQEVKDAVRDVEVARERLRLAERQRQLAAETAASAKRSFEAGVAGSFEVLEANDRLYQAEVALAGARAQLGVSGVALERAAGRAP